MNVSTTRRAIRRILLVITFCGIGYGFSQLPGMVMDYTRKPHLAQTPAAPLEAPSVATGTLRVKAEPQLPEENLAVQPVDREKPTQSNVLTVATTPENETIIKALRTVIDPELGINIVDLGLIRQISQHDSSSLTITIIPTSPLCPYLKQLVTGIKQTITQLAVAQEVRVTIDMEHRWTPDDLSSDGRRHFFGSRP